MKKYDPYNTPTLGRVKPKRHFFHSLLKRHRSDTGLVEDRTSSVTIVRIIGGLLLLHLIIIGGVLLRGHLVRDGGSADPSSATGSAPGIASAPTVQTNPAAPVSVLPPAQQVAPVSRTTAQNHITQAGGTEEEDVAEEVPEDDVVITPAATSDPVYHMVATGDTWQNVADQYAVNAAALKAANPAVNDEELSVGSTLVIPTGRASGRDVHPAAGGTSASRTSSARVAAGAPASGASNVHVVRPGETLSKIARKEKIPMKELMRLNGIQNADRIRPGMQLKLGR